MCAITEYGIGSVYLDVIMKRTLIPEFDVDST